MGILNRKKSFIKYQIFCLLIGFGFFFAFFLTFKIYKKRFQFRLNTSISNGTSECFSLGEEFIEPEDNYFVNYRKNSSSF